VDTPGSLARPTALSLARVSDRVSFLYLDRCRVEQDDNGTLAWVETRAHERRSVYLPAATLSCLLLGPGTTLTQPAAGGLARNGCTVLFVGEGAVRAYSTFSPLSSSTALLNAQAKASVDPDRRAEVAKAMFRLRFPEAVRDDMPDLTIEQLRGMEGVRMKTVYRSHAQRHRLTKWRRTKVSSVPSTRSTRRSTTPTRRCTDSPKQSSARSG
jgi:CRISPR-associated protein Cas1